MTFFPTPTFAFGSDTSDFHTGAILAAASRGGLLGLAHRAGGARIFDDFGFFNLLQTAQDSAVSGILHVCGIFGENVFLLQAIKNCAGHIIKHEGAGEIDHDKKHHEGSDFGHLTRDDGVEIGLIRLFAVGGFSHDFAETAGFLGLFRGELAGESAILNPGGDQSTGEDEERTGSVEAGADVEVDDTGESRMKIIVRGGFAIGVVASDIGEIGLLEADDVVDALHVADDGVSAQIEIVGRGGGDHDADGGIESDEDRELDDDREHGAERLDIIALIEIHHLEGFELFIAVAVFLDFGELGLDFAHEASLVHLALDEGPAADFHQDDEENNRETKVSDETIDDKQDIRDRSNDQHIN